LPAVPDPEGRPLGATYLRNNLGKRSITIDLKAPAGRDLVLRLAPRFDVVAENFRAGTMSRMGLGYDDVAAVHPAVVYVSVSGFGNLVESEYGSWSAFAPVAEAMSSLYDFKRAPDAAPVVAPVGSLGDTGTAVFAAVGILAALRHRDRTGIGQHVDVSMYDAMVAMADVGLNFWSLGVRSGLDSPAITHAFRAPDGWFIIMCSRVKVFHALARTVGHPEWIDDPALAAPGDWGRHVEPLLRPAIEAWASTRTRREACHELAAAGIPVGPCHSPADVVADQHVIDHHMVVEIPRPDGGDRPVLTPGNPIKLSKMAEGPETRMPWLGEHTDILLAEELGLTEAELASLRAAKVIG
jgi:formyl-CoA transferase